jgi:hypothetical protein
MEKIQKAVQVELKKAFQVHATEGKLPEGPLLPFSLSRCRVSLQALKM